VLFSFVFFSYRFILSFLSFSFGSSSLYFLLILFLLLVSKSVRIQQARLAQKTIVINDDENELGNSPAGQLSEPNATATRELELKSSLERNLVQTTDDPIISNSDEDSEVASLDHSTSHQDPFARLARLLADETQGQSTTSRLFGSASRLHDLDQMPALFHSKHSFLASQPGLLTSTTIYGSYY
jgi:hypothetical protein